MSPTDHARELLEGLHLQAHEGGPTTDLSTHYRRAQRLWTAMATATPTAYGEPIQPWEDLSDPERLALAGLVARAVQDVLEVEQVMCRALEAVLAVATEDGWIPEPSGADTVRIWHGLDGRVWHASRDEQIPQPREYVAAITKVLEG